MIISISSNIQRSRTESIKMTIKFLRNIAISCKSPHLLSVAVLSSSFFVTTVMAADGSTLVEDLSPNKETKNVTSTVQSITSAATTECPLNSGGSSLLGTKWRLESIYGNKVPLALTIDMYVSTHVLTGSAGCNKYTANFKQVGYTGFNVKFITKTKKICKMLVPYKGARPINVGSWEGSYLRTLGRMGSVRQVSGNHLHFFNRNGEIGMKFRKIVDKNKQEADVEKKVPPTKVDTEKNATTQKEGLPAGQVIPVQKKLEDGPVVRKISTSDDDLIADFFKILNY